MRDNNLKISKKIASRIINNGMVHPMRFENLHKLINETLCNKDIDLEKSIDNALKAVSNVYGIPEEVIKLNPNRNHGVLVPRQVVMFIAKKHFMLSNRIIGEYFSKNHATVISAVKKIEKLIRINREVEAKYSQAKKILNIKAVKL